MTPQSGRSLSPKQSRGVTATMEVWHAGNRTQKVGSIKLRWMLSYKLGEEAMNETGAIPEFSLA